MDFKLRGNRCADFQFLVDKLQSRLQGWKIRLPSQAGRSTLISSVLQALPLYTFACFKVPDTNQAMLAKQFWKISHNPQSLLAQTYKSKYFPNCSIQDCVPKSHHSWYWKNIINHDAPTLKEGRWWIGSGFSIPLNHKFWFQCPDLNLSDPRLPTGTVGDLIDHGKSSWKADLVRSLYPPSQARDILQTHLPKTNSVQDKILWKHSINGDYQVRTAYELLNKGIGILAWQTQLNPKIWSKIWKVKVPLKINHFIWKLLHNSLPTFLNLKQMGISLDPTCPLCHEEDEASTHLFLLCPFARACWHGSSLAIHASDYANISIQHWLNILLTRHNLKFPDSTFYLSMDHVDLSK